MLSGSDYLVACVATNIQGDPYIPEPGCESLRATGLAAGRGRGIGTPGTSQRCGRGSGDDVPRVFPTRGVPMNHHNARRWSIVLGTVLAWIPTEGKLANKIDPKLEMQ